MESPFTYAACHLVIMLFSKKCDDNLLWMIDSAALDSVGRRAIGLYIAGSDFKPDRFHKAVKWAILKISGKYPISKQLLNTLERLNEIGVAMILMNLPEIPQCDEFDFFSCLSTLETSIGEVLMLPKLDDILIG